jgi:hypothetical protein
MLRATLASAWLEVIAVTFGTLFVSSSIDAGFVFERLEEVSLGFVNTVQLNARTVRVLTPQAKTIDNLVITLNVYALEIVQKTPALRDHLEQAAPRMVIFLVRLEMLGQLVNALAEQCDLNLGRTRITFVCTKFPDDSFLGFFC